jgi:hypothetical protein
VPHCAVRSPRHRLISALLTAAPAARKGSDRAWVDLTAYRDALAARGVAAQRHRPARTGVRYGPVSDQGWGRLTTLRLPGGGALGRYEARHPTAFDL